MSQTQTDECCPRFDPQPWDEVMFSWEGKRFVKARVFSFLHLPLNYGAVMKHVRSWIEEMKAFVQGRGKSLPMSSAPLSARRSFSFSASPGTSGKVKTRKPLKPAWTMAAACWT